MKHKINFILSIIILFSINLHGQNDTINQINDEGLKFGYWKEYHENGKIRAEGNYRIIERQLSNEEIFFYDLNVTDSIVIRSVKTGVWLNYDIFGSITHMEKYLNGARYFKEEYSYDENGKLLRTERNGIQTLFGIGKNIEIDQIYYFISGTIGNTYINYINLKSLCDQETRIIFNPNSDRIKFKDDNISIEKKSKSVIPFTYSIQSGQFNDYIDIVFINPDTNKIRIEIESYGYHLASHNLQISSEDLKTIKQDARKLIYLREYEECEMKIYDYQPDLDFQKIKNEDIVPKLIFPLSYERNEIDLKKLKKGEYLLTTIDYRNEIKMMIKLIKE